MKLPLLEEIFTQLVQHENTEQIAQQMVEVILNQDYREAERTWVIRIQPANTNTW